MAFCRESNKERIHFCKVLSFDFLGMDEGVAELTDRIEFLGEVKQFLARRVVEFVDQERNARSRPILQAITGTDAFVEVIIEIQEDRVFAHRGIIAQFRTLTLESPILRRPSPG
jgi:hypothetical protein